MQERRENTADWLLATGQALEVLRGEQLLLTKAGGDGEGPRRGGRSQRPQQPP